MTQRGISSPTPARACLILAALAIAVAVVGAPLDSLAQDAGDDGANVAADEGSDEKAEGASISMIELLWPNDWWLVVPIYGMSLLVVLVGFVV